MDAPSRASYKGSPPSPSPDHGDPMNRSVLLSLAALVASGCVVRTYVPAPEPPPQVVVQPPAPPPPTVRVFYGGQHMIPASAGGGWCYIGVPHEHEYWPDNLDWYVFNDGYYFWRGTY